MDRKTDITSSGIKKILKNYKPTNAFAEYIWNGFDAKATSIEINYTANKLGRIDFISITDNGHGIDCSRLERNFDRFYDSEKTIEVESPKNTSIMHGKNGVGRLTFFTFAHNAEWTTCYQNNSTGLKNSTLTISSTNLKNYKTVAIEDKRSKSGTTVKFRDIIISKTELEKEIFPFVKKEFAWFLELNKEKGFKISINGLNLDYGSMIQDNETYSFNSKSANFDIRFIQWSEILNKEYSKFYFLNESGDEVYKDFTTLNRKGDQFYHSVFIRSAFFNDFDFKTSEDSSQTTLFAQAKTSAEYKNLIKNINEFLRSKRKPFLRLYAEKLVNEYENDGVLPKYNNSWEVIRKNELKETLIGLYEVQPKIFINLNIEQKKTFVRFLDLLLDSNEKEHIFNIIDEVANLDTEERKELSGILKTTTLNRIISTIKLVEDRFKTYYNLKELVFNESLNADEVHHLQTIIENHYWIFGEQYHLVTSAEQKFTEALRRYLYLLRGEEQTPTINHPDKNREMDIFLCRQEKEVNRIQNVVVELKHPKVKLGEDQLSQVKRYMNVILSQPEFNASNMTWDFILIGNQFNSKGEIELAIENALPHGEKSLAWKTKNYKIYVKTWSEIFNEFELKHNFIDQKLKLERELLTTKAETANEIIHESLTNSAIEQGQVKLPTK